MASHFFTIGSMTLEKLRAWWSFRQGLDGRLARSAPAEVLRATGWARSVGGVAPYLTLFARAGISRETADAAVAALEIHELPAARGCTYVVPACDFALALRAGAPFAGAEMKTAAKLGVNEREVARLCEAVLQSLESGPLDPEAIRAATGKASRSLGEEGRKKGLTTTLPLALERLQVEGEIRRVPLNGRLDQQRYQYALWRPNPLAKFSLAAEEVQTELARRYFQWIGPATMEEYRQFSGLGSKAAAAAVEPLKLAAVDDGRLLLPEDRDAFQAFRAPTETQYRLASSLDGIALLRWDAQSLVDSADLHRPILAASGKGGGLAYLPDHAIFDRGRLIGLWEYDPQSQSIAWKAFVTPNRGLKAAVARMEEFVREQLGDARGFSLDSPKSRVPRIAALRAKSGSPG